MRIAVIGPQNTGKSTFIRDFLVAFPKYRTSKETYRDIVRGGELAINQNATEENQRLIRDFLARQAKENKIENIIFDRCIVDNYIYTLAQTEKGAISQKFLKESEAVMYETLKFFDALIFIPTATSVSLVKNKFRDTDTIFIDQINTFFIETLFQIAKHSQVKIIIVSGTRKIRIDKVKKELVAN
ncbi:MAG: AAA family ATPase [Candidatus Pacebacteria bacterium]|nr:AAA family ATPase [Candidatus Paceibacterota bacterium]